MTTIDTTTITDEVMQGLLARTKTYTVCILRPGPAWGQGDWERIIWEHGRRNLAMREQGLLAITQVTPGSDQVAGVGVYDRTVEEVRRLLEGDVAVRQGVLTYELYPSISFPGDSLPD